LRLRLHETKDTPYLEDLVNENLFLLEKYASHKVNQLFRSGIKNITKTEIISIGYEGLHRAAITYDEMKSSNFQGYAWYSIDLSLKTYQRKIDGIHHVARSQIKKIRKTTDLLVQKLDRQPTDDEIAQSLKIDTKEVHKFKRIEADLIEADDDFEEYTKLVDEDTRADKNLEENERETILGRDMNDCLQYSLSEDQRQMIELMYMEYLSAEDIADRLGKEFNDKIKHHIYNTVKNCKLKLKKCMENKGWSITDV